MGATGPAYIVPQRRRRMGLTNYKRRLALVKSGLPRMVVRKSLRGVLVQFVSFDPKGDRTIASVASNSLAKNHGWPSRSNAPTAYLAALLCAKQAQAKGVLEFVPDFGMHAASKGAIVYAALAGAIDAGLKTNYPEKMIDEDAVSGKRIAEFAKMKNGSGQFSAYGADVSALPELFLKLKQKIIGG